MFHLQTTVSLASVHSQEAQDVIHALTGSAGAWIGLTDFLDGEKWLDGSAVKFTSWRGGEPNNLLSNQHCVWVRPGGEWDDIACKEQKHYVCQKPIIRV